MNRFTKTLATLLTSSTLFLMGCGIEPTIQKKADLTGDGIEDIVLNVRGDYQINYLFIGQKDGTFLRTREYSGERGAKYFKSDDGRTYFFDGTVYRESIPFNLKDSEE